MGIITPPDMAMFGGDKGYTSFGKDGTIHFNGDATTFDDLSFPAVLVKRGANTKPDFDYTNIGLLFPQNDTAEKIYFTAQMPHRKKLGSPVYLHVHYTQTSAALPVFTAEYREYNNGEAVPGSWTTINTSDAGGSKGLFTYTSGTLLQIGAFPAIALGTESVSKNIDVILYRQDNAVTGDVLVKFIDFHFEIDSTGSSSEYTK